MFDLVIRDGTIITPDGPAIADLAITGERIAAIGPRLEGIRTIAATGKLVLPGGVDAHVHLQMPAGDFESSDDWGSGTIAAACGGTTTVIDFVEPELDPRAPGGAGSLLAALERRRAEAEGRAAIDYGLHMTLRSAQPLVLAEVAAAVQAGCPSFKTYLTYDGFRLDDASFLAALEAIGLAGGLAMVHAENDAGITYLQRKLLAAGRCGVENHPLSRPPGTEAEAIERALALADIAGCPLYVAHISTRRGAQAVAGARDRGQAVYGETCPQYLLLNEAEYGRPAPEPAAYVCCPPLRSCDDSTALWAALGGGALQAVSTDHCPFFLRGQKDSSPGDFTRIPSGLPGIEARLALLYTHGVLQHRLSLAGWVECCCAAPARLFGLYPAKGVLAPGSDADVVIFEPGKEVVLSGHMLHEHVDYTPYEGFQLRGYPVATLLRGQVIVEDGRFVGVPGGGRFLMGRL